MSYPCLLCYSRLSGVRDQGADFNKPKEEEVPASWTLQVGARVVWVGRWVSATLG